MRIVCYCLKTLLQYCKILKKDDTLKENTLENIFSICLLIRFIVAISFCNSGNQLLKKKDRDKWRDGFRTTDNISDKVICYNG